MTIAVYPGSFDPIHNGHIDVIARAAKVFDRLIVMIANNDAKQPCFTLLERKQMIDESLKHLHNVETDILDGLLIETVYQKMNRRLKEDIETFFVVPSEDHTFISSRLVKEVARLGGEVGAFVPEHVKKALISKLQ